MTSLRIPLFDQIEEQIGVVVDHARADELTKWVDWADSKADKANGDAKNPRLPLDARQAAGARATAFEAVGYELRAAREKIHDALTAQA